MDVVVERCPLRSVTVGETLKFGAVRREVWTTRLAQVSHRDV